MGTSPTLDADAPRRERGRLVTVLYVLGAICTAIAVATPVLLRSRSWACSSYSTRESGLRNERALLLVFLAALIVGLTTSAVATVRWWRAGRPTEDAVTDEGRTRRDARRTRAGRAALLGLTPLVVLAILFTAPDLVAHCGG